MKIAFFTHRFPVVSETFIVNAAVGLVCAGHEVDIYAMQSDSDVGAARHPALDAFEHRWRRLVFRFRETPRRRIALAPAAGAQLFARHGLGALRAIDPRRFGADARNFVALHEANLFRQGGRYDALHCHFGTLAEPVLNHRDAGFLSGPVFVHFRGYDISRHLREHGREIYADVFRRADGLFTNCDFFRRRLIELGAAAGRIAVVPSAVDLDLFSSPPRPWRSGERLEILCVGRLVEKKGFAYVLETVAALAADGLDVHCRIIGDGPLLSPLRAQAAALGLGERAAFTGAASSSEIAAALQRAHIFMAPSVTAHNGDEDASINTLKEAMAAGRPFVSTEHGGIPELVEGLDAGVLAPERDAGALQQAVHALLARVGEWPEMGARARARIEQRYSIATATQLTVAAYRQQARAAAEVAL